MVSAGYRLSCGSLPRTEVTILYDTGLVFNPAGLLATLLTSVFISVGEASLDANHPSILRQPVLLVYNLISSIVDHAPDLIYKGDHGATYSKVLNLFFLAVRKSTLPNLNLA